MSEVPLYRTWIKSNKTDKPHGELRTVHQKSTCLRAMNFRDLCGADLITSLPKWGKGGAWKVNRVEGRQTVCATRRGLGSRNARLLYRSKAFESQFPHEVVNFARVLD